MIFDVKWWAGDRSGVRTVNAPDEPAAIAAVLKWVSRKRLPKFGRYAQVLKVYSVEGGIKTARALAVVAMSALASVGMVCNPLAPSPSEYLAESDARFRQACADDAGETLVSDRGVYSCSAWGSSTPPGSIRANGVR